MRFDRNVKEKAMKSSAKEHLNDLSKRYPALMCCAAEVEAAAQQMIACYQIGGKLLVCGNGGSASVSLHIVGELMKVCPSRFRGQ